MEKMLNIWYSRLDVKYEMIKYLFNREFAVLSGFDPSISTRHLKAHNVNFLEKNFEMLKFFKKTYNCYYSLDKFRVGLPMFSFDLMNRNTNDWVMNRYKEIVSHDLLMDFDADSFENVFAVKEEVSRAKDMLDEFKVPYSLRYSGKGFHIVVEYKNLGFSGSFNPAENNNIYNKMINILNYMREILDLRSLDVKCTAFGRIMKIPYSLALYKDSIKVCLPLTDTQFDGFDLSLVDPMEVLANQKMKQRGDCMRSGNGNMKSMLIEGCNYAESL